MSVTRALTRFSVETEWDDLPASIIDETKRMLLDHIGCALGGVATKRGRMSADLAERLGGTTESTVIGRADRVSCSNAAYANGELMVALDYSQIVAGGHDGIYVIPTPLAMAESEGASGKDLILATVVGLEISGRLGRALGKHATTVEGVERLLDYGRENPTGNAYSNFGAAAGAGRLLGLGEDRMRHALGIAGHLTMVLSYSRWGHTDQSYMAKYAVPGWQSTGAVKATLLAEMGYTGDVTVLDDPDYGFPYFVGYDYWDPSEITTDLGDDWIFNTRMHYKPYPCCGAFHSSLDCFYRIIEEHDLHPEEIEEVTAYCRGKMDSFPAGGIAAAQFDPEHVFSVAAHRVPRGPAWYDPDVMTDPDIQDFGEKVTTVAHPDYAEIRREDPLSEAGKVEVQARGQTFSEERRYRRGTAGTDAMLSEEELVEKFRRNAEHVLSPEDVDRAVELLLDLENVEDVTELMRSVRPRN